jgi:hypothetical protein
VLWANDVRVSQSRAGLGDTVNQHTLTHSQNHLAMRKVGDGGGSLVFVVLKTFEVIAAGVPWVVDVDGSDGLMVGRRVMLGKVIRSILFTLSPIDEELSLGGTVLDPVETHVDCLGAFLLDGVVGDSGGGAVIRLEGDRSLPVSHFFEGGDKRAGILGVVKEAA